VSSSEHWNEVYQRQASDRLSWYQRTPNVSLELIGEAGLTSDDPVIDVGGGASNLVDALLEHRFVDVSVLDISRAALAPSRERLGARGSRVHWICADVTAWRSGRTYRLWHDRAVFHFLVEPGDQARYVQAAAESVDPGGWLVLATFAPDGPATCSGLSVMRWGAYALAARFAPDFLGVDSRREDHVTPSGRVQPFTWVLLRRALGGSQGQWSEPA
jgi:trans-aconitate methyltransferase